VIADVPSSTLWAPCRRPYLSGRRTALPLTPSSPVSMSWTAISVRWVGKLQAKQTSEGALLVDPWDTLILPRDVRAAWSDVVNSTLERVAL
jgi:hypothetical protein